MKERQSGMQGETFAKGAWFCDIWQQLLTRSSMTSMLRRFRMDENETEARCCMDRLHVPAE